MESIVTQIVARIGLEERERLSKELCARLIQGTADSFVERCWKKTK